MASRVPPLAAAKTSSIMRIGFKPLCFFSRPNFSSAPKKSVSVLPLETPERVVSEQIQR